MSPVLKSLLFVVSVPFLALALEPVNPENLCTRFIGDDDIKKCEERTKNDNIDWYAASVCNLQKDDAAFWTCWDSLQNKKIQPSVLSACAGDEGFSDEQRQNCIATAYNEAGRAPASQKSAELFQPLKIKGR